MHNFKVNKNYKYKIIQLKKILNCEKNTHGFHFYYKIFSNEKYIEIVMKKVAFS